MKQNMCRIIYSIFLVALVGCQNATVTQKRGTQFVNDKNDNYGYEQMVTYVAPEEIEKMTPEERAATNARVGVTIELFNDQK